MIAAPRDRAGPSRVAQPNQHGYFRLQFLDPGVYTLTAHDPEKGWGRLDEVIVGPRITEVGPIEPRSKGGSIAATIHFLRPSEVPDEIVATDGQGNAISRRFVVYSGFDSLTIPGLWPGRWTVRARASGRDLATAPVLLLGTEKAPVELLVGGEEGP